MVDWEERTISWSVPTEAGTSMACDSTCAEGSTFGRERFAFVAERVLDARFLGGILSLNSIKLTLSVAMEIQYNGSKIRCKSSCL